LMNVQPNILFTVHEGAPFVGDHVDDDNLLQKGHPLIMRLQQQSPGNSTRKTDTTVDSHILLWLFSVWADRSPHLSG